MKHDFRTYAVHAGREEFSSLGVHAPPLDLSTTYPLESLDEGRDSLLAMAQGANPTGSSVYARLHNPTVARFEAALAQLERAPEAVAFASGMAAMTGCLLAARQRGRHIVACRPLYGGSDHLLSSGLLDLEVDWATPDNVHKHIRPDTALIILETPGNPTLTLVDIEAVAKQAGDVPLLVDSTFATPALQNPLKHGASLVLHSATKYLGGHGDVMGGVVATTQEWAIALRQVRVATGALMHPLAGYLLHRGLQTLPVRMEASGRVAQVLAQRLLEHPAIDRVYFPGFPQCDPAGLVGRQMRGPGSMIAFELHGGYEAAARALKAVRLLTPAVSLGSTDTLLQHPAALTHQVVEEAVREQNGISPGLLRLSVGLENVDDLWHDLSRALEIGAELLDHELHGWKHTSSRDNAHRYQPA